MSSQPLSQTSITDLISVPGLKSITLKDGRSFVGLTKVCEARRTVLIDCATETSAASLRASLSEKSKSSLVEVSIHQIARIRVLPALLSSAPAWDSLRKAKPFEPSLAVHRFLRYGGDAVAHAWLLTHALKVVQETMTLSQFTTLTDIEYSSCDKNIPTAKWVNFPMASVHYPRSRPLVPDFLATNHDKTSRKVIVFNGDYSNRAFATPQFFGSENSAARRLLSAPLPSVEALLNLQTITLGFTLTRALWKSACEIVFPHPETVTKLAPRPCVPRAMGEGVIQLARYWNEYLFSSIQNFNTQLKKMGE
jgi:hypothetical protein